MKYTSILELNPVVGKQFESISGAKFEVEKVEIVKKLIVKLHCRYLFGGNEFCISGNSLTDKVFKILIKS